MYTNTLNLEKTQTNLFSATQNFDSIMPAPSSSIPLDAGYLQSFSFWKTIRSFQDRQLLWNVISKVLENLSNPNYKIGNMARDIAISQRHLERKIKKMTGQSAIAFRREIRLQTAYQLLEKGHFGTVAEVRFEVGLEHPSYFAQKFQERFGLMPNEILA